MVGSHQTTMNKQQTDGSPFPFIPVAGVNNLRVIGGLKRGTSGTPFSKKSIFRSADPSLITLEGIKALKLHGITTIYDLRSYTEIEKLKARGPFPADPTEHGIMRRVVPVFADDDWSPEAQARRHLAYAGASHAGSVKGYVDAYAEILESGASGPFREILLHVRDKPDEGFLCHCSAGKDRTGVIIAILLKLAGCENSVVAEDYALTEVGLASRMEFIVQYLMRQPGLEGDRLSAERAAGAK